MLGGLIKYGIYFQQDYYCKLIYGVYMRLRIHVEIGKERH
jgi:hypothetical protein